LASAAITGLVGGWCTDRLTRPSLPIVSTDETPPEQSINRWTTLLNHSIELLRSIWRWLLFGVLASAAIEVLLPPDAFAGLTGQSEIMAMLVTLIVALPLYVCATASVPIAAALVASGLPVGAALVFLMAGPATNVATIGAVYRALGSRALAIYLSTVILGSIACGWLFGFLIDGNLAVVPHDHGNAAWWSISSAVVLLGLLGWFAWLDIRRALGQGKISADGSATHADSCCE